MLTKILKIIGIIDLIIIIGIVSYVAYVFISYHRLPDNQKLNVNNSNKTISEIPTGKELKITSYNIGFGAYSRDYDFFMDGGTKSRALSKNAAISNTTGAANVIKDNKSDLMLFQEVDYDSTRAYKVDERKIISKELNGNDNLDFAFARNYDSPYLFYPITNPHGANKSGIMTFSKYKINSALRRSVPVETGYSKILDLDRCYFKSRIKTDNGKELVLYNLHLSAYTKKAETASNQIKQLVKDMKQEYDQGNYCIAGGDFNRDLLGDCSKYFNEKKLIENWTTPFPNEMLDGPLSLVAPYSDELKAASCRDSGKKYFKGIFVITLDGFIITDNVEKVRSDVIDTVFEFSDHNPVYMDFVLKK